MAIMIREFVENGKNFATKVSDYTGGLNVQEAANQKSDVDAIVPGSLMVEIEGIHAAPFATRNFTRYTAKCLKESVPTWTYPYRRPLIKHHNEETGEPIGRVIDVEYVSRNTRSNTPALKFSVNVPDKAAAEGVKNGLLSTVSIGIIAHDVRCSICGSPIVDAKEGCPEGHVRGVPYETDQGTQEVCCWDIHKMEAKELSYVDVPSDMYAKNINYYSAQTSRKTPQLKESLDNNIPTKGEQQMPEDMKAKLEEANAKVSELETKVTELTEAKKASESKTAELAESVEKLTAQVAQLTEEKTALEADMKEAAELKESMEKEIADTKAALKESMVDMYVTLRESMGNKVENLDAIKERPVDALKYSIIDMKESLASKQVKKAEEAAKTVELPKTVEDPTLKESTESEVQTEKRIDLKEGLYNIFNSVVSARK